MKIKKLKLFTNKLELEKIFYTQTLGFQLVGSTLNSFTLQVGWSTLTFEKSQKEHHYHYCFLIPSNQLKQAMAWMEQRVSIIVIESDRRIQHFESWNADSFYFYDASGNVAEFIVRYELDNENDSNFTSSKILCINEIGMPTANVEKAVKELSEKFGTEFWKGNIKRFGTSGSQEGLFLLPNYTIKEAWFPTEVTINPEPFEIQFESNEKTYAMSYSNEVIKMKGDKSPLLKK